MPSVEWTSVGREFGNDVEVYIKDAPSKFVNGPVQISLRLLTFHQNGSKEL